MGLERSEILQQLQSGSAQNDESGSVQTFVHHLCGEPLMLQLKLDRTDGQFGLQLQLPPLKETNLEYKVRLEADSGLLSIVTLFHSGLWEQKGHAEATCQSESDGKIVRWLLTPSDESLLLSVSRRDTNVHDFYNAQCVVIALITPR